MNKIHLFGEMDLDLSKSYEEILKEACRISECCGYVTETKTDEELKPEYDSKHIIIHGEDCHDSFRIENHIHYWNDEEPKLQKVIYRTSNNEMIQVFNRNNLGEWIEIWNKKDFEKLCSQADKIIQGMQN